MENVDIPTAKQETLQYPRRSPVSLRQDSQSGSDVYQMELHHQDPQTKRTAQDKHKLQQDLSPTTEPKSDQTILKHATPLSHKPDSQTPKVPQTFPLNIVELPLPTYDSLGIPPGYEKAGSEEYKNVERTKRSTREGKN